MLQLNWILENIHHRCVYFRDVELNHNDFHFFFHLKRSEAGERWMLEGYSVICAWGFSLVCLSLERWTLPQVLFFVSLFCVKWWIQKHNAEEIEFRYFEPSLHFRSWILLERMCFIMRLTSENRTPSQELFCRFSYHCVYIRISHLREQLLQTFSTCFAVESSRNEYYLSMHVSWNKALHHGYFYHALPMF